MFRFWIFMAGLCNIAAVAAISTGASLGAANGGTHFAAQALVLALLNVPLLAIAALLAATDGRRATATTWLLNVAASAYLISILISSFLVFPIVDTAQLMASRGSALQAFASIQVNPATQVSHTVMNYFDLLSRVAAGMFVIAWVALAASSFGFKRLKSDIL